MTDGRRLGVLVLMRHRRTPPLHVDSTTVQQRGRRPNEPATPAPMAVRTLVTSTLSSSVSCHCTCRTTTHVERVASDVQTARVSGGAAMSREGQAIEV